ECRRVLFQCVRALDALGNAVFNRYLDLQDESDGLPALPLFLSVRAAIRAHVSAAAAPQQEPDAPARTRDEARRYLVHAGDLLQPRPPRLIAIGGLSGTGQSALAYGPAPGLRAVARGPAARRH